MTKFAGRQAACGCGVESLIDCASKNSSAFRTNTNGTIIPVNAKHLVFSAPMTHEAALQMFFEALDEYKDFVGQIRAGADELATTRARLLATDPETCRKEFQQPPPDPTPDPWQLPRQCCFS